MNFQKISTLFLSLAIGLILNQKAVAATFYHVDMPDQETVAGKKLELNGMGLREATVLLMDFDVYVAGLYLEKKTTDGKAIIFSDDTKRMKMQFLMKVPAGKSKDAWQESYEKLCVKPANLKEKDPKTFEVCEGTKTVLEDFKKLMPDTKKGQIFDYTFTPKAVQIDVDGKLLGKIENPALGKFLLMIWVGEKPIGELLRDRLLGVKK